MKNIKSKPAPPLSKGRRLTFSIISILLPFVFLILLELILRISGYGDNFSLFVNHPDKGFENYFVVNPDIGKKYFQKLEYSSPAKDMFLKKKPSDVFRIFVMGSSTVVGFPYENNLMFSRILNERLRDVYPDKKIEIVNTAITAINSFTLADFMPQILDQKPDAILIYAGQNEFYGAFGVGSNEAFFHSPVLIRIHLKLMNLRLYQLTVNIVGKVTGLFSHSDSQGKKGTLMSRIIKDADIVYGGNMYREGINNYEQNLDRMLNMARKNKVEVFISDLVTNLRDIKPFKSISTDGLKGAEEYYDIAKKQEQEGEIQKAKENYILARDYDCIRFRASTDINTIIQKLAAKYQDHFVPTLDLFNSNSPNGIIGENLLVEHVHPNISGEFLMAESFYKEMTKSKVIAPEIYLASEKSFKNFVKDYGYTDLDFLIGKHRITNLKYHWPFVDETKTYTDYRLIYKPTGKIDSLAFTVMAKHPITLTEAHEQLAKWYESKGDILNTFNEYNSLSEICPYWSAYFRKAGDCLLKMNNLPRALRFFERSTENNNDSFYAHFRAGEICMIKNDMEAALAHFQKAQLNADAQEKQKTLIKIYQTLSYLNRTSEGKDILAYFKKLNSNQNIPVPPKTYSYDAYIPLQVKNIVDEAQVLIGRKDMDKAIELLLSSLEIEETPVVYKKLGELYLKKGALEKSQEFLTKAYPEFKFEPQFLNYFILANLSTKHREIAKNALAQLKKIDPNSPAIAQLQTLLRNDNSTNSRAN